MKYIVILLFMYSVICTNEILDVKSTTTLEQPKVTFVENNEWKKDFKELFDHGHYEQ